MKTNWGGVFAVAALLSACGYYVLGTGYVASDLGPSLASVEMKGPVLSHSDAVRVDEHSAPQENSITQPTDQLDGGDSQRSVGDFLEAPGSLTSDAFYLNGALDMGLLESVLSSEHFSDLSRQYAANVASPKAVSLTEEYRQRFLKVPVFHEGRVVLESLACDANGFCLAQFIPQKGVTGKMIGDQIFSQDGIEFSLRIYPVESGDGRVRFASAMAR